MTKDQLASAIANGIAAARTYLDMRRQWDFWLQLLTIVFGLLATFFGGTGAAGGESFSAAFGAPPQGWQLLCFLAATFSLLSVACATIRAQFQIAQSVQSAYSCLAELAILQFALGAADPDLNAIGAKYQDLQRAFPHLINVLNA